MAQIEFLPQVWEDFDRIVDHLVDHGVADAADRAAQIHSAIDVLRLNPLIGRPTRDRRQRELVIGKRSSGYIALYSYMADSDVVLVLAVRSQKEAGYAR